jgi:hypothetical protein
MTKINSISEAIRLFEEFAIKHAESTIQGNYKTGNNSYDKVMRAIAYLKEKNSLDQLLPYLTHEVIGIRVVAATFLLSKYEEEGIKVLKDIADSSDFYSFFAETTLSEWRKGNLKV